MARMHVTNDEIARFRARQLPADALVAFAEHLGGCAECRTRTAATASSTAAEQALDDALGLGQDEHVDELSIHALVNGTLDDDARASVEAHLAACEQCAAEVRDLRAFAAESGAGSATDARTNTASAPASASRTWLYGLAAAALLTLGVAYTLVPRTPAPVQVVSIADAGGQVTLDTEGQLRGAGPLAPETDAQVHDALSNGTLFIPSAVADLAGTRGTLRGAADTATFRLLAPVGTMVLTRQPLLEWTAAAAATRYIVTLQDEASGQIISSPAVEGTRWSPVDALAQGATYTWQVVAIAVGVEQVAPAPPAPPARFTVLPAADAARLATLPPSHLVRGVAYAGAGLLDDAEREFAALMAANPGSAVVGRLSAQVRQARP